MNKGKHTQSLCNLGRGEEELEAAVEVGHQVFQEHHAELNKEFLFSAAECHCLSPVESQDYLGYLQQEGERLESAPFLRWQKTKTVVPLRHSPDEPDKIHP